MSYKDRIATEIINIVGGRPLPSHVGAWFGLYDRPMADPIKYPDSFRVESTGWEENQSEFVYVLYDRFMSSQSMIVIKQSKTVPPLVARDTEIRMVKRSGFVDDLGTEVATVRGCRAVRTEADAAAYEYVYELHFEDGKSTVISESKMKLMLDVHLAIVAEEELAKISKDKADRQRRQQQSQQQQQQQMQEREQSAEEKQTMKSEEGEDTKSN